MWFELKGDRIYRIFSSRNPLPGCVEVPSAHEGRVGDYLADFDEDGKRIPCWEQRTKRERDIGRATLRAWRHLVGTSRQFWEETEKGQVSQRVKKLRERSWAVISKARELKLDVPEPPFTV